MKYAIVILILLSQISMAEPVGLSVYNFACLTCHGENHDGNGPTGKYLNPRPRNLVSDPFKNGDTKEQIYKTITEGLAGTQMPSFRMSLSDAERKAVTNYVVNLRKNKNKISASCNECLFHYRLCRLDIIKGKLPLGMSNEQAKKICKDGLNSCVDFHGCK